VRTVELVLGPDGFRSHVRRHLQNTRRSSTSSSHGQTGYCYADGKPAVQLWRLVFERKAPRSVSPVTAAAGMSQLGQGTLAATTSDDPLDTLFRTYQEAASAGTAPSFVD